MDLATRNIVPPKDVAILRAAMAVCEMHYERFRTVAIRNEMGTADRFGISRAALSLESAEKALHSTLVALEIHAEQDSLKSPSPIALLQQEYFEPSEFDHGLGEIDGGDND